jgi:hypothetical protein
MMLRARRARRRSEPSYALSAWSLAGRLRGRPGFPRGPDDGRDSVDQRQQLGRVVGIGSREADRQRDAVAIHYQVILGAGFAPVDRLRPRVPAPLFARTLRASTLARDQSTAASSPSQLSNRSWSRSQIPAYCQSRNRRQQVVPLPQPSAEGESRQGRPVRSTKMMPPRATRSGMRGRPPLGLSGSMASQRSSGPRDEAFMAGHHATARRSCNTVLA